ncbi:MAG TPA: 50S ribosomal protein L23 [Candidatus Saccharimonadales bacterium]|nr:50S ribosomal protein L23 [Candidatus Saccharimonadales bacterium]
MEATHMTLIPHISEKSYATSHQRTYVFVVPKNANKAAIAKAVEAQFKVKVTDVRPLIQKGKPVRSMVQNRTRVRINTTRADRKKAYITLAEGHKIDIFNDGTEEKEKK